MSDFRRSVVTITLALCAAALLWPAPAAEAWQFPDCEEGSRYIETSPGVWGCNPSCEAECGAFVYQTAYLDCAEDEMEIDEWDHSSECGLGGGQTDYHNCEGEWNCILPV